MSKITVGVLTISDRCSRNEATDESGLSLVNMIGDGIIKNGVVVKTGLVPDCKGDIEIVLKDWCDEGIHLILTTGGTGIAERDVTPDATADVVQKAIPGISNLLFKRSSEVTPLAALSRGMAGIREKSLIINLPGSKKASKECLEAVACIIPHAVDLITENTRTTELFHAELGAKKSLVVADNPAARRRKSAYPCIPVLEAQKLITDRVFLLMKEKVLNYEDAKGYVLAQDVAARDYLPPFDASLKDGYAVLSSDETLVRDLIGVSSPGNPLVDVEVTPGYCARISTGAALPPGADAVVQVEDTEVTTVSEDEREEKKITLKKLPLKGQDIRPLGSDFKMGQLLLKNGTYLDPAAIGLLAAAGIDSVKVFDKPLVGVLSTGDEIVLPNERLEPGKFRDSNRITLISLLWEENFEALDLGIAPDVPEALRDSLERGFRRADIVVTTGSMSMGERDYLKEVLIADFNAEIIFGRVLMKPGKPTSFAIIMFEGKPKLWFGLPGNPVSAFVTSQLFLLPALRKISGYQKIFPISVRVNLVNNRVPLEDRPQYVRGVLTYNEITNSWLGSFTEDQSSTRIGSCVNANCLLEFPMVSKLNQEHKPAKADSTTSNSFLSSQCQFGFNRNVTGPSEVISGVFSQSFGRGNITQKISHSAGNDSDTHCSSVEALLIGKGYFRA